MKTNKSISKRFKVTKKGKVLVRTSGHGHFNAKQNRTKQLSQKRLRKINISNKTLKQFLPYS
jgi:ribosomal protein L35